MLGPATLTTCSDPTSRVPTACSETATTSIRSAPPQPFRVNHSRLHFPILAVSAGHRRVPSMRVRARAQGNWFMHSHYLMTDGFTGPTGTGDDFVAGGRVSAFVTSPPILPSCCEPPLHSRHRIRARRADDGGRPFHAAFIIYNMRIMYTILYNYRM
jgi:hypothetical protein